MKSNNKINLNQVESEFYATLFNRIISNINIKLKNLKHGDEISFSMDYSEHLCVDNIILYYRDEGYLVEKVSSEKIIIKI